MLFFSDPLVRSKKKQLNVRTSIKDLTPGVIVSIVVMLVGIYGATWLGKLLIQMDVLVEGSKTPISAIFVAIIVGILIRNTIGIHPLFVKGIRFSMKYALRFGIILLGFKLSLIEALTLGAIGIPFIVVCISAGLFMTLYLTKKMQQSTRLGMLTACGTSICGITAIMIVAPMIKAKENEISFSVANITLFGLIGMLAYPFLANFFFSEAPLQAGLFLGTAIHDTAQVAGAALIYEQIFSQELAVQAATVTKLTRNLFLIAIIPFVMYVMSKEKSDGEAAVKPNDKLKWTSYIPLFIILFLVSALIRTIGDGTVETFGTAFGLFDLGTWTKLYSQISSFGTTYLLGMAMASVGLTTDISSFKGIGLKPFSIGFVAALTVGIVSFSLITLFSSLLV